MHHVDQTLVVLKPREHERFQAWERPLLEVVSRLGNGHPARTDDSELEGRRISLTMYYRHGLGPESRLAILGEYLGVRAEMSDPEETGTSTEWVFSQDGRRARPDCLSLGDVPEGASLLPTR